MTHLDALIVVEGKTDVDFLSSFLDAEFITTNGSEISEKTIAYIRQAIKVRPVIVLTDPDAPGKQIRDRLEEQVPGLKHAVIRKEDAIKKHKVGVAESNKEVVMNALAHLIEPSSPKNMGTLNTTDLLELGLLGSKNAASLRDQISKKLFLGETNGKTFLKRCNALGIDRKQLEDAIHG